MKEQHKKFCREYIKCGNATQSAIKAGYSEKTARQIASKLLTRPDIKEYIEKVNTKVEEDDIADLEECLEYLTSIIRDKKVNMNERLKAIDIRLKTLAAYETKIKVTNDTININIDGDDDVGGDADA